MYILDLRAARLTHTHGMCFPQGGPRRSNLNLLHTPRAIGDGAVHQGIDHPLRVACCKFGTLDATCTASDGLARVRMFAISLVEIVKDWPDVCH